MLVDIGVHQALRATGGGKSPTSAPSPSRATPGSRRLWPYASPHHSQYLLAFLDSKKEFFDGARSYTVKLPPEILEARFWSLMLHDN
jgi:hypothetical protein